MKLHTSPARLIADQYSLTNHGFQRPQDSALTFLKASAKFPGSKSTFHFISSNFGYYLIQLRVEQTRDRASKLVNFASLKSNNEPEGGSSKSYPEGEVAKSIFLVSADQKPQNSDIEIASSVPNLEGNLVQNICEHAVNQGDLFGKLNAVYLHILAMEQWNASRLKLCHRNYLPSATNLIHYLALNCLDVGHLKEELFSVGLLNLETINPYVLASITAGIQMLKNHKSNSVGNKENEDPMTAKFDTVGQSAFENSFQKTNGELMITTMSKKASLRREALMGPLRDGRTAQIMVTVGKEAIENDKLLSDLLMKGATIVRINCAHGDPSVWSEIIRRAKRSAQMLEIPCRILMDLAGPKLRTGSMKPGPSVMKIVPKKDASGNVIFPAQVWLSQTGSGPPPGHFSPDAVLFIDDQQNLNMLEVGNILRFHDARGKQRMLKILKKIPVFSGIGFVAECWRTTYVESGMELYLKKRKGKVFVGQVVDVPNTEQFIRLKIGDLLTISRDPCVSPEVGSGESTISAPRITCPSSYLFDSVKPGERIAFDDGRIWGVIQGTSTSEIIVSITHASPKGSKLGSEKSINIPESEIRFEGLTSKDLMDLEFVSAHSDMVGVSFIRDVRDVVVLQQELAKRKLLNLGVVLKIETRSGFEQLPLLLLQAMQFPNPLGVMIARGDLAVECGWESLADIQEEILSICTAAHIPVIWATQVLESLVKSGLPTRAEITDVANGRRASCIMLNKGKYITEAVSTLDSMLSVTSTKTMSDVKPLVLST